MNGLKILLGFCLVAIILVDLIIGFSSLFNYYVSLFNPAFYVKILNLGVNKHYNLNYSTKDLKKITNHQNTNWLTDFQTILIIYL